MKKTIKFISALLTFAILVSCFGVASFAKGKSYQGFSYESANGEAAITGYTGTSSELVIPAYIGSYAVTEIKKEAFKDNKTVKSVTVPETVKTIGGKAFALCENLKSVSFGKNVESIGLSAFYGTELYKTSADSNGDVYINNCLIHASKNVDGKAITKYSVKNGTRLIAQGAFYLDSLTFTDKSELVYPELASINVPSSVEIINSFAFYGCSGLVSINLSDGIKEINKNAFEKCSSLKSAVLPKTLLKLNTNLFNGCESLEYVTVCGNPTLCEGAFNNCPSLKSVEFSQGVRSFNLNLFKDCKNLESVTLAASVTGFSAGKAVGCDKLKTVKGCEASAAQDFAAASGMKFVSIGKCPLVFDYVKDGENGIILTAAYAYDKSVIEIPKSYDGFNVTAVGKDAFKNENGIKDLFLPDNVTLGEGAFSGCKNLRLVSLGRQNTVTNAFSGCGGIKALIIPDGMEYISDGCFASSASVITVYANKETFAENFAYKNSYRFSDIKTAAAPEYYFEALKREIDKFESLDASVYMEQSVNEIREQLVLLKNLYNGSTAAIPEIEQALEGAEAVYENLEYVIIAGDANRDGKISVADAKTALRYIAGLINLDNYAFTAADINRDGKVSVADAKHILKTIAGIA